MKEKFVTFRINVNQNDKPFEIGAVKIENNEIVDTFHTFVNVTMDEDISEYFGVYPEQLVGAPTVAEAVAKFEAFIKGATFVPYFTKNKHLLAKYLPNYSDYKIVEAKTIIDIYKHDMGLDDNTVVQWDEIKEFVNCYDIRNDSLGDAVVIAKLFLWAQTQLGGDSPY